MLKRSFIAGLVVAGAIFAAGVAAPAANAAVPLDYCVGHNPGYSSLDTQVRCGFHEQFIADGYEWFTSGYFIYGHTFLSDWYVISGFRRVWYWDRGWNRAGCQGYDAASRTWFSIAC